MRKIKKQREDAAPNGKNHENKSLMGPLNSLGDPHSINKEIHRPEEGLDIQSELISLMAWCTYPMIMLAHCVLVRSTAMIFT